MRSKITSWLEQKWPGPLERVQALLVHWRLRDNSPERIERVARLVTRTESERVQAAVLYGLWQVQEQAAIDRICQVWSDSRDGRLAALLNVRGWVASAPLDLRVLTALQADKLDALDLTDHATLVQLVDRVRHEQNLRLARVAGSLLLEIAPDSRNWLVSDAELGINWLPYGEFLNQHAAGLLVLTALQANRPELLTAAGPEVVPPLLELSRTDAALSELALNVLTHLEDTAAQEAVCSVAMQAAESGDPAAVRTVVQQAGYVPREPHQRALFFFLLGQWDKYAALDFDQSLLRFTYEAADDALRARLAKLARETGRPELVRVVANRSGRRLRSLTASEWQLTIDLLAQGERWQEAWELAQIAPPVWAAKLLQKLRGSGWLPDQPSERIALQTLVEKASNCEGERPFLVRQLRPVVKIAAHDDDINALVVSPDGKLAITGGNDGKIKIWSLPSGQHLDTLDLPNEPETSFYNSLTINSLAVSPDGRYLAVHTDYYTRLLGFNRWYLFDLTSRTFIKMLKQNTNRNRLRKTLAFSPDNQFLYLTDGGRMQVWRVASQLMLKARGYDEQANWVTSSQDGRWLAVCNIKQSQINIINQADLEKHNSLSIELPTGWPYYSHEHIEPTKIRSVAFMPDSKTLITGSRNQQIRFWSVPNLNEVASFKGHGNALTALAVSQDGKVLASGHRDIVRLWDLDKHKPVVTARGHTGLVTGLAFAQDGRYLVSTGADGQLVIWSSRLLQLAYNPQDEAGLDDLLFARQAHRDPALPEAERSWLALLESLLGWRFQHEIELDDDFDLSIDEFDIEIGE